MTPARPRVGPAELAALLALFGLLVVYVGRPIWDIDLFWHVAAGRAFVADGRLATTDLFSAIDPERPWITFQWGYEVLVYGLDALGGLALVKWAHAAVMLAGFLAFWWGCRRRLDLGPAASYLLLALLVVLFEDRIRVRPHVFNLLAWGLLFPDLLRPAARLGRAAAARAAAIVFVWTNLHAGGVLLFLVAAATLPAAAAGEALLRVPGRDPAALRRALTWWAAALVAALVAPNFVRGNLQQLRMMEGTEVAIGEWLPSWHFLRVASTAGHVVNGVFPTALAALWLAVAAWVLAGLRGGLDGLRARLAKVPLQALLFALAMAVLGHRSVRFTWNALFGVMILAPHLPWPALRTPDARRAGRVAAGVAAALCVVVAYRFNVTAQTGDLGGALVRTFAGPPLDTARFPLAQAAFLEQSGFEGRVFAQANWGGYLLYRLHPRVLVTADGRGNYPREVTDALAFVYDRATMADPANGPRVAAVYERWPVDAVVHQHPVWPAGYTPDPARWRLVFADRKGAVWVRDTPRGKAYLEHLDALRAQAPPP